MQVIFAILCLLFSSLSISAVDTGKIRQIFTNDAGKIAISLDGGTPNADSENDTCLYGTSWSGFAVTEQTKVMSSVIMMAKASDKKIQIVTVGCEGAWHKITSV